MSIIVGPPKGLSEAYILAVEPSSRIYRAEDRGSGRAATILFMEAFMDADNPDNPDISARFYSTRINHFGYISLSTLSDRTPSSLNKLFVLVLI